MRLSDENIRGRTVIDADGQALGTVAALFIDAGLWKVESIQVKLVREVADRIGASHNLFRAGVVEIPVRLVQSTGDAVVLSVSAESLREVLPQHEPSATLQ
jgi:sporulation protein YlmC with PRC-barrel domain